MGKGLIDAISKVIDIAHVDVEVMEKIEI